jgi:anti-sigma-K factor RskA
MMAGEHDSIHDLAAGYALDALDDSELRLFEAHLAECNRCRETVRSFQATAGALALAAPPADPPAALRERILDAAAQERPHQSVVVLRPRRQVWIAAAVAAAFAAVAVGLGVWAATLSSSLSDQRTAAEAHARAALILADRSARHLPLGENGQVVLAPSGEGVLVARSLPRAPEGKTYEAWVIGENGPLPAGLFRGGPIDVLLLDRTVPKGAKVAVTVEPAGGSQQPTGSIVAGTGTA